MTRPWVRGELPFLRSGPLYRVHVDARKKLDTFLGKAGYLRLDLDGRAITSRATAHATIGAAFGFPDWYGNSWDAFNDCMGEWVVQHDGALVAVVVDHFDELASVAPATAAEVAWAFLLCAFGEMPSLAAGATDRVDLDVFVIGSGDDFDRP